MNSPQFISHHLFVAAIGNEGRIHERPRRDDTSSVEPADHSTAITLEVVQEARPITRREIHPMRATASQARA
jgi:hypothetical protein